ncbi:MAG: PfkB family carbohydrate kinase, partial [Alloprevotella sp.]
MKDICCIGHITKDKIITPLQTTDMAGGTSYYFSYALCSLPSAVSYGLVTKVGEESMPTVLAMRADGIDVVAHASRHSVFFENKYGSNSDERTQRVLEKADPFTTDELSQLEARVFHLGPLLADDFAPGTVELLAGKGKVSIDAQGFLRSLDGTAVHPTDWQDKLQTLRHTHTLKVNESEMLTITGLSEPREAARTLAGWGVKEVVITLGSNGSLIFTDGQFHCIPAYPPKCIVDATCADKVFFANSG